jgi:hypothetical protein
VAVVVAFVVVAAAVLFCLYLFIVKHYKKTIDFFKV